MRSAFCFLIFIALVSCTRGEVGKPRVFVFTDININQGDPDDRQSLIHLLWYSDELQIEGVVPERWNAGGYEACSLVLEAYGKDCQRYRFDTKGYPLPEEISPKVARNRKEAERMFAGSASESGSPLYVLVWGNMQLFRDFLFRHPETAPNIRLVTIGTHLMMEQHIPHLPVSWEKAERPCEQYNWNGFGRNEVFEDPRFREMWWLEINWTYEGMFRGEQPGQMFDTLQSFGSLGRHMEEVVAGNSWARYFRVGDTPSVLYVIDPANNRDDPTSGSWAGKFVRPFPSERPSYFTDFRGDVEWDYSDPCRTWDNHVEVNRAATGTLLERRDEMYGALLRKLNRIYR